MARALEVLERLAGEKNLQVNVHKSPIIRIIRPTGKPPQLPPAINGISFAQEYQYLGAVVDEQFSTSAHLAHISKAIDSLTALLHVHTATIAPAAMLLLWQAFVVSKLNSSYLLLLTPTSQAHAPNRRALSAHP